MGSGSSHTHRPQNLNPPTHRLFKTPILFGWSFVSNSKSWACVLMTAVRGFSCHHPNTVTLGLSPPLQIPCSGCTGSSAHFRFLHTEGHRAHLCPRGHPPSAGDSLGPDHPHILTPASSCGSVAISTYWCFLELNSATYAYICKAKNNSVRI